MPVSKTMPASNVDAPVAANPWWGSFELAEDECRHWHIGPLDLWIERRSMEWRLAHLSQDDPDGPQIAFHGPGECGEAPENATIIRFASQRFAEELQLMPALADRAIIARPDEPVHLLPGHHIHLYVSTPAWVRVITKDAASPLIDIPSLRPTDTWFGPSTREGELCYAVRTKARLHLGNIVPSPHRILTRIRIQNQAKDDLVLERVILPAPSLSVFRDEQERLWTETLTLDRAADESLAQVHLGQAPPADEAAGAQKLTGPRSLATRNVLVRALNALLS